MIEPDHPRMLDRAAVRAAGPAARELLPPAGAEAGDEPAADAGDRRDVPRLPGLRLAADGPLAAQAGLHVNRKRVQRLMLADGPGGDLSEAEHCPGSTRAAPDLPVPAAPSESDRPNQVLATDITYVPDPGRLHLPLRGDRLVQPCRPRLGAVEHPGRRPSARMRCSGRSPSTASRRSSTPTRAASLPRPSLPSRSSALGIKLSMDGKGRALDNVFVERLWRTVKYDEIYLKMLPLADRGRRPTSTPSSASTTTERPHSAFGDAATP